MKHIHFTVMLRVGLCCAWLTAIASPQIARTQTRVEVAPELDPPMMHEAGVVNAATSSPPDSIDPTAHALARYHLADVERSRANTVRPACHGFISGTRRS